MKRFPRTSSPSSIRVFTSCLLSFLMLLAPVATLAGSVKMAETAAANTEGQRKLTADQKLESFLFNAPPPAATPDVSATMTDSYPSAPAPAAFGETVTYTADIKNDGPADATGVKFNAALDPNTDIVPGSVKVSPLAFADAYVATKNTVLNVGAPGLLTNDSGQPAPTVSAIVGCAGLSNCDTTQSGGKVTVNADGSFDYTPPNNFTGTDTFQYTLSNGQAAPNPGVDDTATVTITIDAPPAVSTTTPADTATGVSRTSNITVNFSEEVTATLSSFKIECPAGGGTQSFTLSSSPATSFTLNPDANLPSGSCTVTVFATGISDTDTNDPPDNLTGDYTFTFTTTNAAPQLVSAGTLSYTENAPATAIDAGLTVTDADGDNISGGSASISTNYQAGQDVLGWTDNNLADNITLNAGATTAQTIVLTGSDSAANYQAALRAVTYLNNSESPNTSARTVTFSATDTPVGDTGTATHGITVTAVNDAPSNTVPGLQKVGDTATLTFSTATSNAITVSDVDAGAGNIKVTVSVPATKGTFVPAGGSGATISGSGTNSLDITGTVTQVNNALNGLVYTPPSGTTQSVTMTVLTSDQGNTGGPAQTDTDTVTINVDQAPFVSSSTPANNATSVGTQTNIAINFSEDVTVNGTWYTISCGSSGSHTAVVSGGPQNFTLNPDGDFTAGETCTVTVLAAQVEDNDDNDPPQNMTGNHVITFTIDTPPAVTPPTVPADNATGIAANTNISITFNEPVNVTGEWFKIECGTQTKNVGDTAVSSVANTYTINPTTDLLAGNTCTVTVYAAQVTDQDGGDPPDNMTGNYTFSFKVPPVAVNDTYSPNIVGNVGVNTDTSTDFSILTNDTPATGMTINTSGSSAQGGTVTVAADGKFSYLPPAGYEGADSFTYTITNASGTSNSATVSLNVAGMIWFINATADAGNDGRLGRAFDSLATFQAVNNGSGNNPAASDNIFIYQNGSSYTGPVVLLPNQKLIGQDANTPLATLAGVTVTADSFPLPSMFPAPGDTTLTQIKTTAATTNAVELNNLGGNNEIYGLTIGDTTGAGIYAVPGAGPAAAGFGTLTVSDVNMDDSGTRTGEALHLTKGTTGAGTVNATFGTFESSAAVNGLNLTNIGGTITLNNAVMSTLTGADFLVSGGGASITYNGTITNASGEGRSVDIQNKTAGTVDFNGLISDSGTGINLLSNANTNLRFDGGLTLNTGTSNALVSTSNGSLAITDPNALGTAPDNTITTTTGTPINIAFTTIHANGVTFKSITANGSTNGIVLNTTGTGPFSVTGNGGTCTSTADCTGGSIQATTNDGVSLTAASNVSLTRMFFRNIADNTTNAANCDLDTATGCAAAIDMQSATSNVTLDRLVIDGDDGVDGAGGANPAGQIGISGHGVNGLVVTNSTLKNIGESNEESAVLMTDTQGTVKFEDVNINDPAEYGIRFYKLANTTLNLTLRRVTVQNNIGTFGEQGFSIRADGGTSNVLVDDCDFLNTDGIGVDGQAINAAVLNLTVQASTFTENRALPMAVNFTTDNTSTGHVKIDNNTVNDCATAADCSVAFDLDANRTSTLHAIITNNNIPSGTGIGTGIEFLVGDGSTGVAEVRDNNVTVNGGEIGMTFGARSEGFGGSDGNLDLTFEGNTVNGISTAGLFNPGVQFLAGSSTGTHDQDVCVNIATAHGAGGNTINGTNSPGATPRFEVTQRTGTTFALQGFSGTGTSDVSVAAHFNNNNNAGNLDPTFVRTGGTSIVNYTTGTCATPTTPTLPPISAFRTETNQRYDTAQAVQPEQLFVPDLDTATAHAINTAAVKAATLKPAAQKAAASTVALRTSADEPVKAAKARPAARALEAKRTADDETFTSHARSKPTAQAPAAKVQPVALKTQPVALKTQPAARAQAPAAQAVKTSKALAVAPAAVALAPAAPVADLPVTIGTLPANKAVRVTFQVTVKSAANYTGTNAFVSAQGTVTFDDPNNPPTGTLSVQTDDTGVLPNTGETDATNTPVDSQPDLAMTKSDGGATAVPGGTIQYALAYNNTNGKREAAGVVITETVPANTTFNAGSSTGTWNCAPNNNAGSTCTQAIGDLPAGDAGSTTTFAVTVNGTIPAGVTDISNTASIADDGAKGADGTPADNTASDTTPVSAAPNLKIEKTADSPGVKAGEVASYTLAYSNIGNQGATGVSLTETVPTGTTYSSADSAPSVWVCAPNNNAGSTCTLTVGSLAAGASGSAKFAVTTIAGNTGQVDNTASIADDGTNGLDADNSDNSDSASTLYDDPPTLGNYSNNSVLITQDKDVAPDGNVAPDDDNAGFDVTVTVSAGYTGGATVNDTTGVVSFTNAGPAGTYTVTVKNTDNIGQFTTKQFQLTVNKSDSATALASSDDSSYNNQNVTFTATVTSSTVVTGPPTGTVDFFDNGVLIGTCDDKPLDGTGKATCDISTLAPSGTPHDITATYNGDNKFLTSTSPIVQQTVNQSFNAVVNTLGDLPDDNPGDSRCDTDNNSGNGDQCTLRAAIQETNAIPSEDVITFDAALNNQAITLDAALDAIDGNLTINGPGANLLTVKRDDNAATQFRIFAVNSGKTVTISGLTISGGDSALDGGGVLNEGTLSLVNVVVKGNRTDQVGGGVRNNGGTLSITGSTFNDNDATSFGGAISNSGTANITESTFNDNDALGGGGIAHVAGALTITNTTISDNRAAVDGGGLRVAGGTATLTNVTVKDNRADNDANGTGTGGGIRRINGTVTLRNTIVAENYNDPSPSTVADDISGTVTGSFNLIGAGGAGTLVNGVNGNQVGVTNPRLGPLADNGGETKTHALKNTSPALDAGDNTLATNAGLANDQRGSGFNRIVDSADPGTVATVDIGAFEAQVSIAKSANQGTAEDTPLPAFNFDVAEDIGITGFTVTATSSDQTLVPDANLVVGGSGTTRTLAITPAADKFGTATITVKVSGLVSGVEPVEMTDEFDFAVSPVADMPDAADVLTDEDTMSGPIAVTKNPVDGAEVSYFRVTAIAGGRLYMPDGTTEIGTGQFIAFTDAAPGLRFRPTANSVLPGHFKVQGATGNILAALGTGQDTSTITIGDDNDPPTLGIIGGVNVLEDSGATVVPFQNVSAGPGESQVLTVTATSSNPSLIPDPTVNYTSPNATGSLSFTPVADGFGSAEITVTVKDNGAGTPSVSRTFPVNVIAVNDAPSFNKGADQSVPEDSGAQSVPNWATSISPGPNEPPEPLGFVITGNTNPALFAVQPAVSSDGTLTYTSAANTVGTSQITLVLKDFRTTENSGQNESLPKTFNITVTQVNDAPTLNVITDKVYNEDSGLQTVNLAGITIGPNESGQTLNVTAASNNTAVVPNPTVNYTSPNSMGSLSFTPVADQNGTATITVTVQDSGGGTDTFQRTFLVTVREVNDAPAGANDALPLSNEDAVRTIPFSTLTGNDSKGPSNEASQNLTITAVNTATGGSVSISGTDVIFTPTLNYNGPAGFTYKLSDDGTTAGLNNFKTSTAQVTFNIKAVNDAPVNQVPGPQTTAKNTRITFTSSNGKLIRVTDADVGTDTMRLVLQVSRGTVTLSTIAGLTFSSGDGTEDNFMVFNGTLTDINAAIKGMSFKPQADYVGAAWIKVTSNDLGHNPGPLLTDADTVPITIENTGSQPVEVSKASVSTFQLGSPTYTVSEGSLRATVTVKRSGDLSSTAAVSYSTSDLSGPGACGLANGNASGRCDYAVGAGTLRFAAGQSSQTVTVPLVNDVYKEGPENFTLTLTKSVGAKLGAARSATVTIADDDDGEATASPMSSDEFFVRQLYLDYLGREPDEKGFTYWLDALKNCSGKDCGREAVAASFARSQEFKERTSFAFSLYRAALGRTARYDELVQDAARLQSARTDAELLENKADYVSDFMGREEFKVRYDSLADADYVDALLVAAALPDHSQRSAWVAGLAEGSLTRGDILRQLAESDEVSAKFADEAEAVMPYLLLLRRTPDAAVGDRGALMKAGDLRQTFALFLNSDEYRKRVGP